MTIKFDPEVDSLEGVDSNLHGFYEQDGDTFRLKDDPAVASAVKLISGLDKSLGASRKEAKALKQKADAVVDLTALADFGESPDDILSAFQTQLEEARSTKGADFKKDVDKVREQMGKAHAKDLGLRDEKISTLTKAIHSKTVVADINAALKDAINPDLVRPFIERQMMIEESEGEFTAVVRGDDGQARFATTGQPMRAADLVEEMKTKEEFQPFFRSERKAGAGTNQNEVRRQRNTKENMTSREKINAGIEERRLHARR